MHLILVLTYDFIQQSNTFNSSVNILGVEIIEIGYAGEHDTNIIMRL